MKSEEPLVSIAVIAYNQEKVIEDCLNSVLNQTYKNIEIIVSDDASSDNTPTLLKQFKTKYPEIFKINLSNKNLGITKNSNIAQSLCKGKYIAWLGGDDIFFPKKIEKQVNFMESNQNCVLCHHNLELFDSGTGDSLGLMHNKRSKKEGDIKTLIKYGTINGASATMIRSKNIPENGFNELIPVASDWLYWIEALREGGKICYLDEVLGKYRRGNKSVTQISKNSKSINQNVIDHLNTSNLLLKDFNEHFDEIRFTYARNIFSLRHKLKYSETVFLSLRISFKLSRFARLIIYFFTFGKIKH